MKAQSPRMGVQWWKKSWCQKAAPDPLFHHINPQLNCICPVLRPLSDKSDMELSSSIYTSATSAVGWELWGAWYKYRLSNSQGNPKSGQGGPVAKAAETHADSVPLLQLSSAAGCHRVEAGKVKRTDFFFHPFNSLFLTFSRVREVIPLSIWPQYFALLHKV